MDCQLLGLQQSSNDILEPRSINHVISIAFKEKPKVNLQEQVKPLGERTNPIQLASGIPYIQDYSELPRMFKTSIDEKIFTQLTWIANKQGKNALSTPIHHEESAHNKKNPKPTPIQYKYAPYSPLQKILPKRIILNYSPGTPNHGHLNA